jgi:hypothetical protein
LYTVGNETGCMLHGMRLVACCMEWDWLHAVWNETGCILYGMRLVACCMEWDWLHTVWNETGCILYGMRLVACCMEWDWLYTVRNETGCILYEMRLTFSRRIYFVPSQNIHILHKIIIHALYALWDYFILSLLEQNRHLTFWMDSNVCDSKMCDGFIITNQSQTPKLYCACLSHARVWVSVCVCVCVGVCVSYVGLFTLSDHHIWLTRIH